MSIFSKEKKTEVQLGAVAGELVNKLRRQELSVNSTADGLLAMESLDSMQLGQLVKHSDDIQADLKATLAEAGFSMEGIAEHQIEAGAIALMGARNAAKYHAKATDMNFSAEGANLIASDMGGSFGATDAIFTADGKMSMEAFENKDLNVVQGYSALWNIGASRQDSASEMLYPTHVLTPDHVAIDVKIPRTLMYKGQPRNFNGDPADFGFQNVLEAYRNHKLLENETTEIIPHVLEDGSNAKFFVDPALVAPVAREMAGNSKATFNAAPFKVGAKFDLLSVSQNPKILEGQTDNTDQLHSKIALQQVYIKATHKNGDVSVIPFSTENHTRAQFTKTVEGDFVEMQLTFSTEDFGINADTLAVDKAAPKALKDILAAKYRLRLGVEMSGKTNLQTATTSVFAAPVEVLAAFDPSGKVALTGAVGALLADVTFEVIGYDLQAFRTNSNLRTRGLLIDRNWKVDRFALPLGSPISVVVPLSDDGDSQAMNDLINTTNIRNSNLAMTRALNYGESLKAFCKANEDAVDGSRVSLSIEGIARFLVTPHYEEMDLDVLDELNSLNSTDRVGDVNAVLVNAIRTMAYNGLIKSNYLPALRQFTQGSDEKPNLQIVTDLNLPQYLMVTGDPRTVSIGMDFQIESTPDLRLTDTILLTFGRKSRQGVDYMSFGTHVWMPELVSVGQIHYQGANVKQLMVQPRNQHIHQLPIMMKINVKNLREAIAKSAALKVQNTVVTP